MFDLNFAVKCAPIDLAWAAGLYEGEGTIWCWANNRGPHSVPYMKVASTDEDVIRRFAAIVGGGAKGPYRGPKVKAHWKSVWVWKMGSWSSVDAIARALWPWLGNRRREQIRKVFENAPNPNRLGWRPRPFD